MEASCLQWSTPSLAYQLVWWCLTQLVNDSTTFHQWLLTNFARWSKHSNPKPQNWIWYVLALHSVASFSLQAQQLSRITKVSPQQVYTIMYLLHCTGLFQRDWLIISSIRSECQDWLLVELCIFYAKSNNNQWSHFGLIEGIMRKSLKIIFLDWKLLHSCFCTYYLDVKPKLVRRSRKVEISIARPYDCTNSVMERKAYVLNILPSFNLLWQT